MTNVDPVFKGVTRTSRGGSVPRICLGTAAFILALAGPVAASSPTAISFELFPEFYSVVQHHDPAVKGHNGFWFRRINVTFDNALSTSLSFRFRLEMSSAGDFRTNALLTPFVKDACLSYRFKGQDLQAGIIGTPTWENIESFWGYRALEKTPCDLQKLGSARDFGVSLKGPLNSAGTVAYKMMFGNGEGNNAETNKGKKAYAQIVVKPGKGILVDLYADTERREDSTTRRLFQAFMGCEGRWGRAGFLYALSDGRLGEARDRRHLWSALAVVKAGPRAEVILRFDRMADRNTLGPGISFVPFSDRAPSNLVIAGIGWRLSESLIVIPNVKTVIYDKLGGVSGPGPDTYLNLSAHLKF